MEMKVPEKFTGVFPAFLACYDDAGEVSPQRAGDLALYYRKLGIPGLYVTGSSGECMLQTVEERKRTLEGVMDAVGGTMTVIAHVAAPATRDSIELARHAEKLGADGIAMVPGVYYGLNDRIVFKYWTDVLEATDRIPMFIYNIPATTNGYNLPPAMFARMRENPRVAGVKNTSSSVQDILKLRLAGGPDAAIFNGYDEQYLAGRAMGASGGIGTTYGFMPELFLKLEELIRAQQFDRAAQLQREITAVIYEGASFNASLIATAKAILELGGVRAGKAREPFYPVEADEMPKVERLAEKVSRLTAEYC